VSACIEELQNHWACSQRCSSCSLFWWVSTTSGVEGKTTHIWHYIPPGELSQFHSHKFRWIGLFTSRLQCTGLVYYSSCPMNIRFSFPCQDFEDAWKVRWWFYFVIKWNAWTIGESGMIDERASCYSINTLISVEDLRSCGWWVEERRGIFRR
jgi:hypothetical protein